VTKGGQFTSTIDDRESSQVSHVTPENGNTPPEDKYAARRQGSDKQAGA